MPAQETAAPADGAFHRAWDDFCDGLKQAGRQVLSSSDHREEADRAEGILQLVQLIESALRYYLVGGDADFPRFVQINDTAEIADNMFAPIRDDARYLLRGNMKDLHDINVSVHAGWGFVPSQNRRIWGDLGRSDIEVDADGNFELLLGPDLAEGEGLRLEPGAAFVQLREFFTDWANHKPGRFEIVRLGSEGEAAAPPSFAALADGLAAALEWARGYQDSHQRILKTVYPETPNSIAVPEKRAGGNRNLQYGFGRFDLEPDDALIVSFPEPKARVWTIQWLNRWYEVVDQANRTAGLISTQAHLDGDGMVRIVIAPEDPGCPNWLDCHGHLSGVFVTRWFWGEDNPPISCEKVPLAELRAHLPADHPQTTREDRIAFQALRRSHFASRRR